MSWVVADTGPVNYLIQIGQIELLPRLFERVVLPRAVLAELSHPLAPTSVQKWIAEPPAWLEIAEARDIQPSAGIHKGEAAAMTLSSALFCGVDALTVIQQQQGGMTGTLGLLDLRLSGG